MYVVVILGVGYFALTLRDRSSAKNRYELLNLNYIIENEMSYKVVNSMDTFKAWMNNGNYDWELWEKHSSEEKGHYVAMFDIWGVSYRLIKSDNEQKSYLFMSYASSKEEIKTIYQMISKELNAKYQIQDSSDNYSVWKASDTRSFTCTYEKDESRGRGYKVTLKEVTK
ncbi:hypothetical protein P261_02305 [Lachnospiraceae bacterium TWA4]|nr:hypothetical protein P261_02305 [Lachnospiraceae bacterium TWA4]